MTAHSPLDRRLARARAHGFTAHEVPRAGFAAKPGSHDDGPAHGMFLGPVGGPAFSRDLHGRFSRWHLQPGMHLLADLESAFLAVRWRDGEGRVRHARLRRDEALDHEVTVLHPTGHEVFTFAGAPFRLVLTAFSPVIPPYEDLAALPVVVLDVVVEPLDGTSALPAVDVALFWPNLNGWRASPVTSDDRGDRAWPGHHHAGNVNVAAEVPFAGAGVLQRRQPPTGVPEDLCGDVLVSVGGEADRFSRQVEFNVESLATGVPEAEQTYTLGAVWDGFVRAGRLGLTPDSSWPAHWHEPIGSAVAAHSDAGAPQARARFSITFDWPVVRFGQGRCWWRRYTALGLPNGSPGRALAIAERVYAEAGCWLDLADSWQETTIERMTGSGTSQAVAGCVVNDLNLVVALGSAWVHGTLPGHEPADSAVGGAVGGEHFGLLEGFDTGYFYYNTSDLFHYAFPALTATWPRLADLVFADLGAALQCEVARERPIYRQGELRPSSVRGKLPHDLGSAAEDPFVRINGYAMRDDPNAWRDANPAFVLATVVHHRLLDRPLDDETWSFLRLAADVAREQVGSGAGVPRHDEFGDSTWDNLGLRGYSTYTAALCAGMWGVMAGESRARGEDSGGYEKQLSSALEMLDTLWTGRWFRAASEGKYVDAVMGDSLLGLYYAARCGVHDLVAHDRIVRHLRTAYRFAHAGYHDGRVGPLLVAEECLRRYGRDGGEELQVNEVLVGSAWLTAAMLAYYGLDTEAGDVAGALQQNLYGGTGLQFRTPAALDADGHFRAPLNLRPLAAWWLAAGGE